MHSTSPPRSRETATGKMGRRPNRWCRLADVHAADEAKPLPVVVPQWGTRRRRRSRCGGTSSRSGRGGWRTAAAAAGGMPLSIPAPESGNEVAAESPMEQRPEETLAAESVGQQPPEEAKEKARDRGGQEPRKRRRSPEIEKELAAEPPLEQQPEEAPAKRRRLQTPSQTRRRDEEEARPAESVKRQKRQAAVPIGRPVMITGKHGKRGNTTRPSSTMAAPSIW